jgi:hypothetical protein
MGRRAVIGGNTEDCWRRPRNRGIEAVYGSCDTIQQRSCAREPSPHSAPRTTEKSLSSLTILLIGDERPECDSLRNPLTQMPPQVTKDSDFSLTHCQVYRRSLVGDLRQSSVTTRLLSTVTDSSQSPASELLKLWAARLCGGPCIHLRRWKATCKPPTPNAGGPERATRSRRSADVRRCRGGSMRQNNALS